jgi:flagellin
MSTQKENLVSAQNAIQATDYAAATSNMSKYEILSQTGIVRWHRPTVCSRK